MTLINKKIVKSILIFILVIVQLVYFNFFSLARTCNNTQILKTVTVFTDKKIYNVGDEIKTIVLLTNSFNLKKHFKINCSFLPVDNLIFSSFVNSQEMDLRAGETKKTEFTLNTVNMAAGKYKAKIDILDGNYVVNTKFAIFELRGGNKILKANIKLCLDFNCQKQQVVFIKGDTIYFQIDSKIDNLDIDALILTPNQKEKQVNFSNNIASFTPGSKGSYTLKVNIKADGYYDLNLKKDFAVIAAPAKIKSASVCHPDGQCIAPENKQNCPQDCLRPQTQKTTQKQIYFWSIVSIIVIIFLGVVYFLIKKQRKKNY